MFYDGDRDDESDIFSGGKILEGDTYHLVFLQDWPPTVSTIDCCIDLDGEEAGGSMDVLLEFDSGNDSLSYWRDWMRLFLDDLPEMLSPPVG